MDSLCLFSHHGSPIVTSLGHPEVKKTKKTVEPHEKEFSTLKFSHILLFLA